MTLTIDPLCLSVFNESKDNWDLAGGDYKFQVGGSSRNLPLVGAVRLGG